MKLQVHHSDYKKLSDEELIHRFVHRQDNYSINILFERYGHLVYGVCVKYLKDAEAGKDATQQIFIKLLDDLPRFKIENFKAWLLQVTRNFCLMQLRKEVPVIHNELITNALVENDELLHQKIDEEHLYEQLEKAIEQLNEEQRTCINLFYLQKKTYAQIVAKTNYNLQEVKSHLQNGKRNLRIKMEALKEVKK